MFRIWDRGNRKCFTFKAILTKFRPLFPIEKVFLSVLFCHIKVTPLFIRCGNPKPFLSSWNINELCTFYHFTWRLNGNGNWIIIYVTFHELNELYELNNKFSDIFLFHWKLLVIFRHVKRVRQLDESPENDKKTLWLIWRQWR